ncbi:MAG TPA: CHAP domain-containing protein [Myxococcales bacterium]|nr:CHAP domain-containing protein [Myxococcales bacterium]
MKTAAAVAIAVSTGACITSRAEEREPVAAEPPQIVSVPVATSSVATPPAATPAPDPAPTPVRPLPPDPVQRVLDVARAGIGKRGGSSGVDCSTYVRTAYLAAGIDLYSAALPRDNGVQAIHRYVRRHGRLQRARLPASGDLVFFDNSYDRNRNRLLDDPLTHVGIVEEVLSDRTILVLHATNHGIVREPMNLRRPHRVADASGQPINAALRRRSPYDGPRTPHLMSELFAGFGTVLGVDHAVARTVARRSGRAAHRH